MMRAPDYWQAAGWRPALLAPAAAAFRLGGRLRRAWTAPDVVPAPVLCVGNLVAGGAGKTPVALALAARLDAAGRRPHFLTRGYGGSLAGPVRVDPAVHDARAVGDEALLLAAAAPCWVARDRPAGARAAIAAGAGIVVMDDGLQNPTLRHDAALLVVDGGYGFGNGRVMPAGPLRETLADAMARVAAVVLIGEDRRDVARLVAGRAPILRARLKAEAPEAWRGRRVLAFAGIGRPGKFFDTLRDLGAEIVAAHEFADHHPYRPAEILALRKAADAAGTVLVTTAKDRVRLPAECRAGIAVLAVSLVWEGAEDAAALDRLLAACRR